MKVLIIVCFCLVSACGMQGDLYLPKDKPVQDKPAQDKLGQDKPGQDGTVADDTDKETGEGS